MTSLIYLLGVLLAKEVVASGILPSITAAPVLNVINTATTDIGYYACMTAEAAIGSCSSALGGLDDLPNSRVAQCLCCSGSAWSPEPFDDSAESCAAWIKTGLSKSTTQYSAYSTLADFCESQGNVCSASSTTTTATRTRSRTSSSITRSPAECYSLLWIIAECALSTTGIVSEPIETQAACYCYTSSGRTTTWVPNVFDGYASVCADWMSTADATDYSAWSEWDTFCTSVGDVLTSTTTTSSSPTAAQTGQSSGGTTSKPTTVTVTVIPSSTSTNAAGAIYSGQESVAFGITSLVMAIFSLFL